MENYFLISGYYKDDNSEFIDYLVKENDDMDEETDDDVFFYGLSEHDINEAILIGEETVEAFVITSYTVVQ